MIQFINVSKAYKEHNVIENINLEINKGELVVLIGPSGCGKTTILKMINRLIEPSDGQIKINGTDIEAQDPIELRRNIGYVIQQTGLFIHMTVRENIEIIPRLAKMPVSEIVDRTVKLMETVGLPEEFLDRYPNHLSGGQQQRVGVARAFAMNPDIILMDEPFSALDPLTRSQLQDELVSLQSKLHKTIVFVTHDMDEAVKIADRICILQGGRILQYDTPENILKNPAHGFVSEFVGSKRIWSSPQLIRAKDIMITSPKTTYPYVPMFKGLEKMRIDKVDSLIVIDEDNHLLGIVRARSILNSADKSLPVETVMTPARVTADTEENIVSLLEKINGLNISNIPVTDRDNRLAGLITNSSLVTTMSHQFIGVKGGAGA
ncbi:MAG TPA: ABC transporter ATP-binding protein [Candidatus Fusicatenibacter intestinipullorum]|jgi:osmoprotectant transport system ATP-binding protein|nr:ABC transporter ATP-binding protein [Phascolarctobacterium faecium]MDM8108812.1 ABC transporter ATP-binding protein [Phascolarctobacterium faecium]HJA49847.1 ABC transporter ATP-binding protein [Candidatus Fusicatenibacter intestinipullorum]